MESWQEKYMGKIWRTKISSDLLLEYVFLCKFYYRLVRIRRSNENKAIKNFLTKELGHFYSVRENIHPHTHTPTQQWTIWTFFPHWKYRRYLTGLKYVGYRDKPFADTESDLEGFKVRMKSAINTVLQNVQSKKKFIVNHASYKDSRIIAREGVEWFLKSGVIATEKWYILGRPG